MNLHIVSDSKFSNTFYRNLQEIGLLDNNKIVVRSNQNSLSYISTSIPFAPLYSKKFSEATGDVSHYTKVFIHQFSPLMYRWVARNKFQELNWMIWGGDLYNLPFVKYDFYEPKTLQYVKANQANDNFLYLLKVYLTNMPFRKRAYSKVKHVLTWMESEYDFALQHIPSLQATHKFFFYENQAPYHALDDYRMPAPSGQKRYKIMVGNSGTPTNNHLDAISRISQSGLNADLVIPVGYGEAPYIDFLKKNVSFYSNGSIQFIDKFMDFSEYVKILSEADGLVMNHIRPQGYGNILMMMYLGKPVFLNTKNISLPDLKKAGLLWNPLDNIGSLPKIDVHNSREKILTMLSHEQLVSLYGNLFG
jgi:dTDP-N-acetylfucosamine:lipid II N-acetylfucosaminyltransferase